MINNLINMHFKHTLALVNFFTNDRTTIAVAWKLTHSNDIKATLNQNKSQTHDSDTINKSKQRGKISWN